MPIDQSNGTKQRLAVINDHTPASTRLTDMLRRSPAQRRVRRTLSEYSHLMAEAEPYAVAKQAQYATIVNHFYDLVTDFYEYGWGHSFHFATRFKGETMREATARFEHFIALRLGLRPGLHVLDAGCGVGGPMQTIARFSGASILGVNNNDYQVKRANAHICAAGLESLCSVRKGDYMALDLPADSVDCAYAIEATCHAPSLERAYAQIRRVLKPRGLFACVESCTTASFDPENHHHRRLCDAVTTGNGLMGIPTMGAALDAARAAGFAILDAIDLSLTGDIPWYEPLSPAGLSAASFRCSKLGRWCTSQAVGLLELLRIAPRGSRAVSYFLNDAAESLIEIGKAGIFTPDFLIMMQKPLQ